jgi:dTDP-4-dehydrorhamnose reductase
MEDLVNKTSLVIGASGQIGEHCLNALRASGESHAAGTYRQHHREGLVQLDITDARGVNDLVAQLRPKIIYLAACVANVDYCETHPDVAYQTNVRGVANVVQAANQAGCKLVYLSSEYIFDGHSGPYDERAATNPLSVYGWQKLAAEHYIAAFAEHWLIIRTTVVYSWESQGKNFVYRLRSSLLDGKTINVPCDQISSPTYAPDLVDAILQLTAQDARGVFNVAGPRVVNRFDFAVSAASAFDLDPKLVIPVKTSSLAQPALRPLNAGLIVTKVERALGRPMKDFSTALKEMAATVPAA